MVGTVADYSPCLRSTDCLTITSCCIKINSTSVTTSTKAILYSNACVPVLSDTVTALTITTAQATALNNNVAPWPSTDTVTYTATSDCLGATRMTIGTSILVIGSLYSMF